MGTACPLVLVVIVLFLLSCPRTVSVHQGVHTQFSNHRLRIVHVSLSALLELKRRSGAGQRLGGSAKPARMNGGLHEDPRQLLALYLLIIQLSVARSVFHLATEVKWQANTPS